MKKIGRCGKMLVIAEGFSTVVFHCPSVLPRRFSMRFRFPHRPEHLEEKWNPFLFSGVHGIIGSDGNGRHATRKDWCSL